MKEGWKTVKLGRLCEIKTGRKDVNQGNSHGKYPFFTCAKDHTYSDVYSFEGEALLIAGNGDVGNISYYNGKFEAYQRTYVLMGFERVLPRYLFRVLDGTLKAVLYDQKLGNTMPYIKKGMLTEFPIPLPPLPEQKRIVAILDKAFEGITAAVANAEKNLANTRELFETYLNSIFTQKGEGWVETTLGDVADFKNGLNFTKSSKGERIKIVGVKDFQSNYWVPMDKLDTVQIEGVLSEAYTLREYDILTVRSNGNKQLIGRCVLADGVPEKTSHSGFTIRIRVYSSDADPTYLVHYLKSGTIRERLVNLGGGLNISSLNQKALSSLPVLLPKRSEQLQIVTQIEAIEAKRARLVAIYQKKLAALAELKQSILQKAFAGELTAKPETIVNKEAVA